MRQPRSLTLQHAGRLREYLKQLRQETITRLLGKFEPDWRAAKWWFSFSKRKFLNKSLPDER